MSYRRGELTSLALCWRLERLDGAGIALTSHDVALTCGGRSIPAGAGDDASSGHAQPGAAAAVGRDRGRIEQRRAHPKAISSSAGGTRRACGWRSPTGGGPRTHRSSCSGRRDRQCRHRRQNPFPPSCAARRPRSRAPVCPATSPECRAQFGDKSAASISRAERSSRASLRADGGALTLDATCR